MDSSVIWIIVICISLCVSSISTFILLNKINNPGKKSPGTISYDTTNILTPYSSYL